MISLPFSPIFEYFLFAAALLPDEKKNPTEREGGKESLGISWQAVVPQESGSLVSVKQFCGIFN